MDIDEVFYRDLGKWVADRMRSDNQAIKDAIAQSVAGKVAAWDAANSFCESEIERILFGKILFSDDGYKDVTWNSAPDAEDIWASGWGTTVQPQGKIGKWRADFLFTCIAEGRTRRVVVECDGHDFHERTKEQSRRDKSRDRAMVEQGVTVLRFTGSEIYGDAVACCEQIAAVLKNSIHSAMAAAGAINGQKDRP